MISLCVVSFALCLARGASVQPEFSAVFSFASPGAINDSAAVGAAALAGAAVVTDTAQDSILILDAALAVVRTFNRTEIAALLPWMTLTAGPDGPSAAALSDSGRLAFVLVHDDALAADGLPSDAILRIDLSLNGTLGLFARLDAFARSDTPALLAIVHYKAQLWVGTDTGTIATFDAPATATSATLRANWTLPTPGAVTGFAIDRDNGTRVFASTPDAVYVASAPAGNWSVLATNLTDVRSVAWGDHYGGATNRGLYVLRGTPTGSAIDFAADGELAPYCVTPLNLLDIAATATGTMLAASDAGVVQMRDASDTRLDLDSWMRDEFEQVTKFASGLISPDGQPPGWVIDSDTEPSIPRYHPATPDGAGWTVLLLLMAHHLNSSDAGNAEAQIASVLTRYAGLAADKIRPSRTRDGIFRHWMDPATGEVLGSWDPEFATLSTMFVVAAADRAAAMFPNNAAIVRAAHRIVFNTRNWDAYIKTNGSRELSFKGLPNGGPDNSWLGPFFEGVVFVEQAAAFGSNTSRTAFTSVWLNRTILPSATWLPGMPISSTVPLLFEAAFISIYPALLTPAYRADPSWRAQVANVRWSNAAWTDDNGPRFFTVFSAGTTKAQWGGYHADSLTLHPGDITTFPSLLGLAAFGDRSPAVSAYVAFRKGARQTWRTGASLLYRFSNVDPSYVPNSAGLPDVVLGALGLAELIAPGSIDAVLARPYAAVPQCPSDVNADGHVTWADLDWLANAAADLNGDNAISAADAQCLIAWLQRNEPPTTVTARTSGLTGSWTSVPAIVPLSVDAAFLGAVIGFAIASALAIAVCMFARHRNPNGSVVKV